MEEKAVVVASGRGPGQGIFQRLHDLRRQIFIPELPDAPALAEQIEHLLRFRQRTGSGTLSGSDAVTGQCALRTDRQAMLTVQAIAFQFGRDRGEAVCTGLEYLHDAVFHACTAFHTPIRVNLYDHIPSMVDQVGIIYSAHGILSIPERKFRHFFPNSGNCDCISVKKDYIEIVLMIENNITGKQNA